VTDRFSCNLRRWLIRPAKLNVLISNFIQLIISLLLISCCEKTQEPDPSNVTDIEGNTYEVIRIGKQFWMKENLKTTKFINGIEISNVTDSVNWRQSFNTPPFAGIIMIL